LDAPRYRSQVGPPRRYDLIGAMQFNVMTQLGLRDKHSLLDIGCGSLRGGRLFIPYLLPGNYFGIEPERWKVEEGIDNELGRDAIRIKEPTFSYRDDFKLSTFGRRFDFMLAQSIFSHATQAQIRTCLREAAKLLDTLLAATYFPGPKNYDGTEWTHLARYRPDFIESLATEAGLTMEELDWPHPSGQQWVVFRP
jgi:hypothetical protein